MRAYLAVVIISLAACSNSESPATPHDATSDAPTGLPCNGGTGIEVTLDFPSSGSAIPPATFTLTYSNGAVQDLSRALPAAPLSNPLTIEQPYIADASNGTAELYFLSDLPYPGVQGGSQAVHIDLSMCTQVTLVTNVFPIDAGV